MQLNNIARSTAFFVSALALTACSEPFGFASGGELSGELTEPPAVWAFEEDSALAQLETNPDEPYSINLVYVQLNGNLYAYAGDTRTNWVQNIERNPDVKIRIGDAIYPLRAVRVPAGEELTAFAKVWAERSIFQRDPMQFEEVWLYRLESRGDEA